LHDTRRTTRRALAQLWRNLGPGATVVLVVDARTLPTTPPDNLRELAELVRGKLGALPARCRAAVSVRVCLTHLDQIEGYDELATVHVHENFAAARAALPGNWFAIETGTARRHVDARFSKGDVLLFGSERRGLPPEVLAQIPPANVLTLPMRAGNRSLNLSNAAAIAVYEAWRQAEFAGAGLPVTPA
jgi:tRNA(Leu) C34 or U34 (ribose-2'-O)-methylase TrmL